MATSTVKIPKDTWTLVSTVSVSFQNTGKNEIYAVEAAVIPTGDPYGKIIAPRRGYGFAKLDGNLYVYSVNLPAVIAIDPVS